MPIVFMAVFATIGLVLAVAYAGIVAFYSYGWRQLPQWKAPEGFHPRTRISVLVPARNEAEGIAQTLETLLDQRYPAGLYEVIVLDDFSEDDTAAVVRSFEDPRIRLLRMADFVDGQERSGVVSFKKKALETGVAHASGDLILTTDADCRVPSDWLRSVAAYYEAFQPAFMALPVRMHQERNLLERFQSLDFLGMMLLTGAGIQLRFTHLANGAGMAFPRAVFEAVGGYAGADHLASGDDLFLLHKILLKYPGKIAFVKTPLAVLTQAQPTLRQFIRQRLRWGTKSAAYSDWKITVVLAIVFFHCWSILLSLLLIPLAPLCMAGLFGVQVGIKAAVDFYMLRLACRFFDRSDLLRYFWISQPGHILYIAGIGLASNLVRGYEWKGRQVR